MVARAGGRQGEQGSRKVVAFHMSGDSAEVELLTSEYDSVGAPNEERFILVRSRGVGLEERAPVVLIENWLEEVKERGGG